MTLDRNSNTDGARLHRLVVVLTVVLMGLLPWGWAVVYDQAAALNWGGWTVRV